jgi:hypothetical protein
MPDIAATSCADALIAGWIRGPGAADLRQGYAVYFCHLGRLVPAAGYPAPANHCFQPSSKWYGQRCHRRKDALRARLTGPDWPLHLPWVLMGLRAAPTEDTGVSAAEVIFGAPLVLPGQILDTGESPPADFMLNCGNPVRHCPWAPSPTRRWRPSRRRHSSQRRSSTSGRAARSLPCRRSTAARTGSSPPARRFSGYRSASGRRLFPSIASSRTGGPPPSSQRSHLQEAGRELADFSSHPLSQGLVLAWGPVAERTP